MAVLGFLMPPETGEKINMIITTLLSMGVYLQSITESIPPTSEAVPLIGTTVRFRDREKDFRDVLRRVALHGVHGHVRQRRNSQHSPKWGSQSGSICYCNYHGMTLSGTPCAPMDGEVDPRLSRIGDAHDHTRA